MEEILKPVDYSENEENAHDHETVKEDIVTAARFFENRRQVCKDSLLLLNQVDSIPDPDIQEYMSFLWNEKNKIKEMINERMKVATQLQEMLIEKVRLVHEYYCADEQKRKILKETLMKPPLFDESESDDDDIDIEFDRGIENMEIDPDIVEVVVARKPTPPCIDISDDSSDTNLTTTKHQSNGFNLETYLLSKINHEIDDYEYHFSDNDESEGYNESKGNNECKDDNEFEDNHESKGNKECEDDNEIEDDNEFEGNNKSKGNNECEDDNEIEDDNEFEGNNKSKGNNECEDDNEIEDDNEVEDDDEYEGNNKSKGNNECEDDNEIEDDNEYEDDDEYEDNNKSKRNNECEDDNESEYNNLSDNEFDDDYLFQNDDNESEDDNEL